MPRVNWGIKAAHVDDFDRESRYKPYNGPVPHNGVYQWKIKALKFIAGSREKNPQLRIGLELVPRSGRTEERRYAGYFVMEYAPVTERAAWRYVPFLDAIGVSGRDFTDRTLADEEGNIRKIGKWSNDGKQLILAELKDDQDQNGNPRKAVGWIGPLTDECDDDDDDDEDTDEYDDDDEEYDDEYED